tara:strand:+ start:430 stop:858 length:429 start_codon:yes stop_codon:yes gene_type:complete
MATQATNKRSNIVAYITTEETKQIRNKLKEEFPNLKFSVSKGYGNYSVNVAIVKGDVDFRDIRWYGRRGNNKYHIPINQYHLYQYKEHEELFEKILNIIKTAPDRKWFDHSNSQIDYFCTAYYIDLSVGNWKNPYIYSGEST